MNKCFKLITFDATNTLLKFRIAPWRYYKDVVAQYGYEADEDLIRKNFLVTYKLINEKYPNFGKESIGWEDWWCQVVKKTLDGVIPQNAPSITIARQLIHDFRTEKCWCAADGAHELVNKLTQYTDVGVISNFDPRLIDVLSCLQLHNQMKLIVLSYNVGCAKPSKRIYDVARETCGGDVKPLECLHIGDDLEKDYYGARAAGWHALMVTQKKIEKPPARVHVFTSLDNLCIALEQDEIKF